MLGKDEAFARGRIQPTARPRVDASRQIAHMLQQVEQWTEARALPPQPSSVLAKFLLDWLRCRTSRPDRSRACALRMPLQTPSLSEFPFPAASKVWVLCTRGAVCLGWIATHDQQSYWAQHGDRLLTRVQSREFLTQRVGSYGKRPMRSANARKLCNIRVMHDVKEAVPFGCLINRK